MAFVYMVNKELNASHHFPDDEGVILAQEARGWKVEKEPEEKPFVSLPGDADPEVKWVTLYHPETTALHDFPNNPGALQAAQDSGWELPPVPKEEEPVKKPSAAKKTASAKSADDEKEVK